MEEYQKHHTVFLDTSYIACVFVGGDLDRQESRCVVRRLDLLPVCMTHLIEPIGKFLCLLSLIVLVQGLTHSEEIT